MWTHFRGTPLFIVVNATVTFSITMNFCAIKTGSYQGFFNFSKTYSRSDFRLIIRPRCLQDVSKVDPTVFIFGKRFFKSRILWFTNCKCRYESPLMIAPTAFHKMAHPEGELATVKGILSFFYFLTCC